MVPWYNNTSQDGAPVNQLAFSWDMAVTEWTIFCGRYNELDNYSWLVVLTILKNMKVNGKDDIPYIMENKNVLKHQPDSQ